VNVHNVLAPSCFDFAVMFESGRVYRLDGVQRCRHPHIKPNKNRNNQELLGPLMDAAGSARRALAGLSDLERTLARLAASAGGDGGGVVRSFDHCASCRVALEHAPTHGSIQPSTPQTIHPTPHPTQLIQSNPSKPSIRPTHQGREAPHVVLYEDVSKKRVGRLVGAVRDMGAIRAALASLEKVSEG
jgi:hypothetical protein